MDARRSHLRQFTDAIVLGQTRLFEPAVKAAYASGAHYADLLTAVDIAKALATVPPKVVTMAYRVVRDWRWIEVRRTADPQALATQEV
jgi:hypothetical protein